MRKLLPLVCLSILAASTTLLADNWPHWRGPTHDGVSKETGSADQVERDRERRLEAAAAGLQRIDADHLGRHDLPEHGDGQRHRRPRALGRRSQQAGRVVEAADRRRQPHRAQAEHVLAVAGHRRQHVWVMTGVGMLKAFDFAGKELWSRDIQTDYGRFGLNWGYASSPLLHDERALRAGAARHEDGRHVRTCCSIDKVDAARRCGRSSGRRTRSPESPDSYTTPALLQYDGKTEIVITGGDVVTGHDPATGKELWRADVLNPQNNRNYRIVASPIIAGGTHHRAEPQQPARRHPAGRHGRHLDARTSPGRSSAAPTCRRPVSDGQLPLRRRRRPASSTAWT